MLPKVLRKEKFGEFVELLMDSRRVVAPVANGHQFSFREIACAEDIPRIRMDYDITILPPKKFILPVCEKLLEFESSNPRPVRQTLRATATVIIGVHPYDLHALATTDAAMTQDPLDPYYQVKRRATLLIGLNVLQPANDEQFQTDMGTLEPPEGGFDLFLTDLGDRYYVEIGSQEGSALAKASGLFEKAGSEDHRARQEYDEQKADNFPRKLPYNTRYLPELLDSSYDSLLWDAIARRCFSCGTCTNVCPTCYCFDVQDVLNIDTASGIRQRVWDSCQLKVFAEVAGGENFREHRASRLRHRVFRKAKFVLERTGRLGCVGCGRCSTHCVAKISILEAFQQIADEATETIA